MKMDGGNMTARDSVNLNAVWSSDWSSLSEDGNSSTPEQPLYSAKEDYAHSRDPFNIAAQGSSISADMDEDEDDEADPAMFNECPMQFYASQISASDYQRETTEYTRKSVEALISSAQYQRIATRCQLCWCVWAEGQCSSLNCFECGGYAMTRPCPVCSGKCGAIWSRDVELSHSQYEAHWNGECKLPVEERQLYLTQYLISNSAADSPEDEENNIADGFADLMTS